MPHSDPSVEELLDQASESQSAMDRLLALHRSRLKKMVTVRMDDRLSARVDPSDIVQESLIEAARRLPEYLEHRRVAFYPWLRGLAMERIVDCKRRHLAAKRSVLREDAERLGLSNRSAVALLDRLVGSVSSPSRYLNRRELQQRVREALDQLGEQEREILVLRYLEDCPTDEIAEMLGVTERTIRRNHRRALAQLSPLLQDLTTE